MKIDKDKILNLLNKDYEKLEKSLEIETNQTKIDYSRGIMIYIKILRKSIEEMVE